jgi:hypothetical protein
MKQVFLHAQYSPSPRDTVITFKPSNGTCYLGPLAKAMHLSHGISLTSHVRAASAYASAATPSVGAMTGAKRSCD